MGFNIGLRVYVIDYLDPINGGIPVNLGIDIEGVICTAVYWVHREESILETDDRILKIFGVSETTELPFYNMLIDDIETLIDRELLYESARIND